MEKSRFRWVLYILIGFVMAGCQLTHNESNSLPIENGISSTEAMTNLPMITATSFLMVADPTITPTPDISNVSKDNTDLRESKKSIDCEQDFCQISKAGYLQRPFSDLNNIRIDLSYPYASTNNGLLDVHHGVEFQNAYGTEVLAAGDGEVVFAGVDDQMILGPYHNFYGSVVIIRHPNLYEEKDLYTLYGHLSSILVDVGDHVEVSDPLGKVGASGAANGPHLHFEVRLDVNDYDHTVNPVLWLTPLHVSEPVVTTSLLAGVVQDSEGIPIPEAKLTLEKIAEDGSVQESTYFISYYKSGVNAHPLLGENFAIPDLNPGKYRLSFVNNQLYEIYFTLEPGILGFVTLLVD